MALFGHSRRLPFAIAGVLLALLAALATLQWRWIGEVSVLERQRLEARLSAAAMRFAADFDGEVTRAFLYFRPDSHARGADARARLVQQRDRWLAEAPYPGLVRALCLLRPKTEEVEILRPSERRFETIGWPAEWALLRQRLDTDARRGDAAEAFPRGPRVDARIPGLLIPLSGARASTPHDQDPMASALLFVWLDERTIAEEILPALTRQHFGSPGERDYALAVVETDDPAHVIFRSDPAASVADFASADLRLPLLGIGGWSELRSLGAGRGERRHTAESEPSTPQWDGHHRELHGHRARWTLLVKRRHGSLEEVVASIRRRNLGVSLAILGLVAATAGIMVVTTQRAQRLARQQIEFVAGVTHELHTPLTAIRSAGENLADEVVAQPDQVRHYGALVEREGRRLSSMVGQLLELAGIRSGRRAYRLESSSVGALVEGALSDSRWLLEEKRIRVESDVPADLPPVMAEPPALRRALQNLIENAVKYGGEERWLGIRARRGLPAEVAITVVDRGPGISREDLRHLFEPFYRGRGAATAGVPGSGLGLSLVRHIAEAHRGRVSVGTGEAGRGSAFTLHLPAAPDNFNDDLRAESAAP